MYPWAKSVLLVLFILAICEARRITRDPRLKETELQLESDTLSAEVAEIDADENAHGIFATSNKDDKPEKLDPEEPWAAENALARCRSSTSLRTKKVYIGAPMVLLVGTTAWFGVVQPAWLNVAVNAAAGALATGIKRKEKLVGAGSEALQTMTVAGPIGKIITLFLTTMVQVFGTAGWLIVIPAIAELQLMPIVKLMGNAEELASIGVESSLGVDTGMRLLGYGDNYPNCCCAPGLSPSPETCALVSSSEEAKLHQCPPGWTHDATQCAVPEVIQYSDKTTVAACQCKNATECSSNPPWQGHAWCDVLDESHCGWTYMADLHRRKRKKRRWDYCSIDGRPLEFAQGHTSAPNDALATFIPNSFEHSRVLPGPNNVFSPGTWVDAARGLTIAKASFFNKSQCFAGEPVETLGACAQLCLQEGAPTAITMSDGTDSNHTCVAFAYHRTLHLCVRLPAFAADDAEFTPHLTEWTGDGWQNFVSKYYGDDADSVCPSSVLLDIQESGYNIIRDKNNGHLFVQCANSSKIQKVSCIAKECGPHTSNWCFVSNSCRSGVPRVLGGIRFLGRCRRKDHFECGAGTSDAVVPGDDNSLSENLLESRAE